MGNGGPSRQHPCNMDWQASHNGCRCSTGEDFSSKTVLEITATRYLPQGVPKPAGSLHGRDESSQYMMLSRSKCDRSHEVRSNKAKLSRGD